MLTKRLAKCGNSLGIIIPKALRDILGWTEETELECALEGQTLRLTPLTQEEHIDLLFSNDEHNKS